MIDARNTADTAHYSSMTMHEGEVPRLSSAGFDLAIAVEEAVLGVHGSPTSSAAAAGSVTEAGDPKKKQRTWSWGNVP